MSKRARPDLDLTISFLCTRVAKSTTEDWDKLRRLIGYIKSTLHLRRIIGAHDLSVLYTWVDASYAIHRDLRGHTGGVISLGSGMLYHNTSKQKINTKSSTETEVVGASDFLPWLLWVTWFMKDQGYSVNTSIFFQDNESAIRLEKNGKASSRNKTRHINIRYFFIKDIIKRENITIKHCKTELMIADFFTKPLQGKLFRVIRDQILGLTPIESLKEHVGINKSVESISAGKVNDKPDTKETVKPPISVRSNRSYADIVRGG